MRITMLLPCWRCERWINREHTHECQMSDVERADRLERKRQAVLEAQRVAA